MTNQTIDQSSMPQQNVPNAVAVLVLGICSIALCWCYGLVSLGCGITALVLASKGMRAYNANPAGYREGSFKNLKAGKICAIIGTILGALYLVFIVIYVMIIGAALTAMPWDQMLNK